MSGPKKAAREIVPTEQHAPPVSRTPTTHRGQRDDYPPHLPAGFWAGVISGLKDMIRALDPSVRFIALIAFGAFISLPLQTTELGRFIVGSVAMTAIIAGVVLHFRPRT